MSSNGGRHRPTSVVAIASMPRTGSNLLCAALGAVGVFSSPKFAWEVFNPLVVFGPSDDKPLILRVRLHAGRLWRWWGADEPWKRRLRTTRGARRAYLDHLADARSNDTGVLMLKAMWSQFEQAMVLDGLDLGHWAAPVLWIHTRRRDQVRQAVSLALSEQTGIWWAGMTPLKPRARQPHYDADFIENRLAAIRRGHQAWEDYFASIGALVYEVVYEDLDADYDGTMRRVLDHLGHPELTVAPRQLERQSDGMNDEWVERFLVDRPQYRSAPSAASSHAPGNDR